MRIKILQSGEIREEKDGYALRLIEQGKAVAAPAAERRSAAPKAAK